MKDHRTISAKLKGNRDHRIISAKLKRNWGIVVRLKCQMVCETVTMTCKTLRDHRTISAKMKGNLVTYIVRL
jgi:hypothetical protein